MRKLFLMIIFLFGSVAVAYSGYREDFEKEFLTKPWADQRVEESACISCHTYEQNVKGIPPEWSETLHYINNVSCHDCHGGDPKDASMAMSHQRGFVGVPKPEDVPEFCGKCHLGIMKNYLESGHGKALKSTGKGPNCVTCHNSHKDGKYIQKANINLINEQLCTRCHSYERAKIIKQALFLVEKRVEEVERNLSELKKQGVFSHEEERDLFSTHAEFRALFHSIDVQLIKNRTDQFIGRLDDIDGKIRDIFAELQFRRNFSAYLTLLFAGMAVVVLLIMRTPGE